MARLSTKVGLPRAASAQPVEASRVRRCECSCCERETGASHPGAVRSLKPERAPAAPPRPRVPWSHRPRCPCPITPLQGIRATGRRRGRGADSSQPLDFPNVAPIRLDASDGSARKRGAKALRAKDSWRTRRSPCLPAGQKLGCPLIHPRECLPLCERGVMGAFPPPRGPDPRPSARPGATRVSVPRAGSLAATLRRSTRLHLPTLTDKRAGVVNSAASAESPLMISIFRKSDRSAKIAR